VLYSAEPTTFNPAVLTVPLTIVFLVLTFAHCKIFSFLAEFADIIERIAVYSATLIVLGDINTH